MDTTFENNTFLEAVSEAPVQPQGISIVPPVPDPTVEEQRYLDATDDKWNKIFIDIAASETHADLKGWIHALWQSMNEIPWYSKIMFHTLGARFQFPAVLEITDQYRQLRYGDSADSIMAITHSKKGEMPLADCPAEQKFENPDPAFVGKVLNGFLANDHLLAINIEMIFKYAYMAFTSIDGYGPVDYMSCDERFFQAIRSNHETGESIGIRITTVPMLVNAIVAMREHGLAGMFSDFTKPIIENDLDDDGNDMENAVEVRDAEYAQSICSVEATPALTDVEPGDEIPADHLAELEAEAAARAEVAPSGPEYHI